MTTFAGMTLGQFALATKRVAGLFRAVATTPCVRHSGSIDGVTRVTFTRTRADGVKASAVTIVRLRGALVRSYEGVPVRGEVLVPLVDMAALEGFITRRLAANLEICPILVQMCSLVNEVSAAFPKAFQKLRKHHSNAPL